MDGVVTILDPPNYDQVINLWKGLQSHCGLPEIKNQFSPHFSWHVAESYDCERLNNLLEDASMRSQQFIVRTAGLGIFPGDKPIVYLGLVKDRQLIEFHEKLWEAITPLAVNPSLHYSPQNWVPHITIFFDDIFDPLPAGWDSRAVLRCVIDILAVQNFDWSITVNNFAYGCMEADQMSFNQYEFGNSWY